ncbi:hypothetical protein QJS10_CPA02g00871 [Acorus calamus]|uniref:Uncharacterized protein n=1 Tax=Acorus calamus TaxID=4465 RepID=A0AAV9FEZ2_ACOCL|nr:hypothetical protein QJS10_CPA02g00871 [Acorus calamus]
MDTSPPKENPKGTLCKALASLKRYWEALEIINHCLKFVSNTIPVEKLELRSLGAQIAYKTTDPKHGYDCARYMVQQRPYNVAAWNCYYKVVSRLVGKYGKHAKFLNAVHNKFPDCVPPMIINGHQFSMISQHQTAAREYLEAYKAQPGNPLISLCAGKYSFPYLVNKRQTMRMFEGAIQKREA